MTNPLEMGDKAVRFLVKSCPTFDVDDAGFIINMARTPPQRHVLKIDPKNAEEIGKEIVIYQEKIPDGDYYLLNPYAEGLGLRSPPLTFLYDALSLTAGHRVGIVLESLVLMLLESKVQKGSANVIPEAALRIVSKHKIDGKAIIDLVDDKMPAEITTILDALGSHYVVPAYVPAQMTARLVVKCLSNPDFETSFGKTVRKKTVKIFLELTKAILDVETDKDLVAFETKYNPDLHVPPKMFTFLSTLLKMYLRFGDALEEVVADPAARINLGELSEVIEQIPLVFPLAKNAVISQSRSVGKVTNTKPLSRGTASRDDVIAGRRNVELESRRDTRRDEPSARDAILGIDRSRGRNDDRNYSRSRYNDDRDDDRDYNRFGQPKRRDDDDRGRRRRYRDDDDDRGDTRLSRPRGGNYDSYRRRTSYS